MDAARRTRSRVERLRTLEDLIGRRPYGALELAQLTGMTRRTIERDLEFLKRHHGKLVEADGFVEIDKFVKVDRGELDWRLARDPSKRVPERSCRRRLASSCGELRHG